MFVPQNRVSALVSLHKRALVIFFGIAFLVTLTLTATFASSSFLNGSSHLLRRNPHSLGAHHLNCTFDYRGPLFIDDLGCFAESIPYASPVYFTEVENGVHDLSGIRIPGGKPPIPIFITFKDRITYLVETIRALHRNIRTPFEIVIIDDTSTFPAAVQFVERLVDSKVTVLRVPQYESGKFDSLYAVIARMITEYMKERSKADYFVWTDPDVPLDSAPGDILEVYAAALEGLEAHNVGAAIRNDNWTEDMRDNKHGNEQDFIKLPASCFVYREICYYYIHASIDTTFAMYRRNTVLQRLVGPTARMLSPLAVHHLDYLIDKTKIPEDVKYYVKRTKGDITHSWFKDHVEKSPS